MNKKFLPYKSGYLDVTDGHCLYYECFGNPLGKPILYLHGGPGLGIDDSNKRFFNPKIWNVILFDQRGSGKSKPFATLHENNTQKLIEDINSLLDFLSIDKVIIFGGSWGSTLSLIYAIQNKKRVLGLILRGIYYGNKEDIEYLISGAIKDFFPEKWERFMKLVPKELHRSSIDVVKYYFDNMTTGSDENMDFFAYEWSYYESAVEALQVNAKDVEQDMSDGTYKALSKIEASYMLNHSFVPNNYILDNAHLLSDLPISINHGRYDFVCAPINAWKLHKAIPKSKLNFVFAGHSSTEYELEKKLIEEVKLFEQIV